MDFFLDTIPWFRLKCSKRLSHDSLRCKLWGLKVKYKTKILGRNKIRDFMNMMLLDSKEVTKSRSVLDSFCSDIVDWRHLVEACLNEGVDTVGTERCGQSVICVTDLYCSNVALVKVAYLTEMQVRHGAVSFCQRGCDQVIESQFGLRGRAACPPNNNKHCARYHCVLLSANPTSHTNT